MQRPIAALGSSEEVIAARDGVEVAHCVVDASGRIVLANPAAVRMLATVPHDPQADLWARLPERAVPLVRAAVEATAAFGEPHAVEAHLPAWGGRFRIAVEPDAHGIALRFLDTVARQPTPDEARGHEELVRQLEARALREAALARQQAEDFDRLLAAAGLTVGYVDRELRYVRLHNPHPDFDAAACIGWRDHEIDDDPGILALSDLKLEVVSTGRTVRREIEFARSDGPRSYLVHAEPVWSGGDISGVKTVSLDITDLRKDEAAAATTDYLTGAVNRRAMARSLRQALHRARRHCQGYAVILLDVDHFKRVNDRHGHLVGDAVLQELVRCLRQSCRPADSIARWGGEEFLVLLPDTDEAEALQVAERMRRRVEAQPFAGVGRVTISVGVAVARDGERTREVVGRADAACYRAKHAGRNRVLVAEDHASAAP
jgi:diguanylate cyclase (GGDEF)-like protein